MIRFHHNLSITNNLKDVPSFHCLIKSKMVKFVAVILSHKNENKSEILFPNSLASKLVAKMTKLCNFAHKLSETHNYRQSINRSFDGKFQIPPQRYCCDIFNMKNHYLETPKTFGSYAIIAIDIGKTHGGALDGTVSFFYL